MATTLQGAGLGYKRAMAEDFLHLDPAGSPIRFIEVAPENWMRMGGAARRQFDQVAERFPVACHGLSLSLGGQDPLRVDFLKQIKDFIARYRIGFFSEHLSYCGDNGFVYDLLPLPFTWETVRHTAARIRRVQEILEMRIAVENTSYYAHSPLAEMSEVEFLNAVAREADCDIHLDVNNIYVNAFNHNLLAAHDFIDQVDALLAKHGIPDEHIILRVTGCPNGCGRAMLAEIGLVGKAVGRYNLFAGGNREGTRIPRLYKENITEPEILAILDEWIGAWARERQKNEGFGDYAIRVGIVKPVLDAPRDFWAA